MRYVAIKSLAVLIIFSLISLDVSAVGLQEYLQNTETDVATLTQTPPAGIDVVTETSNQLTRILELVVAGIVASALIISVLVLFLGRWLARREKLIIKELRMAAEQDKENITSAAATIREQEKETTKLTHEMRNQATEFSTHHETTEKYSQEIIHAAETIKEKEQEVETASLNVSHQLNKIQSLWDVQVQETVATIHQVQENLDRNLDAVGDGLGKMEQQKVISQELLQDFLDKHNEQSSIIANNSDISQKVGENIQESYKESLNLLKLLKKQQSGAEKSLKEYTERLSGFEEQAYEQFDTSFQVADLARQELTANLEESRKHVETMRRQEEQSHSINTQTMKNLESLDYSKILKISSTLDNTQNMFDEIHTKVEETRHMLEELKEIESGIKQTIGNVEYAAPEDEETIDDVDFEKEELLEEITELENAVKENQNQEAIAEEAAASMNQQEDQKNNTTIAISDYKMASGDSTPLSFFRNLKH
jgi:hypothetical protein